LIIDEIKVNIIYYNKQLLKIIKIYTPFFKFQEFNMNIGHAKYNDGSDQENRYSQKFLIISNKIQQFDYNVNNEDTISAFNYCKQTFNKNINYAND